MLFSYIFLTNIATIFLTYYIEKTLLLKFYAFLLHCSIAYYWQMNRDKNNKLAFEKFKTVYSDDCSVRIPASILNDCNDQYKFITFQLVISYKFLITLSLYLLWEKNAIVITLN